MSVITENVIPGNHGRIFTTNATTGQLMQQIKVTLEQLEGVKDVIFIEEISPREFIVRTKKLVTVREIQNAIQELGLDLHVVPKGIFPILES